jgi:hypothetical protein
MQKTAWVTTSVNWGLTSEGMRIEMSHHASGPDFGFPHGDARLDMTDLYPLPTRGRRQVNIDLERSPVGRREPAGAHNYGALRAGGAI